MSRVSELVAQNYRRWITDDNNAGRIGETGLYSLQNGLLLTANMHRTWDSFGVAVDPDVRLPHSSSRSLLGLVVPVSK